MPVFHPIHTPRVRDSLEPDGIDPFTRGYLECAEWLARADNETGEMTDDDRHDCEGFHPDAIAQAKIDCADFLKTYNHELQEYEAITGRGESSAGHDFYLSRNGHGAGFFDRGNHPVFRTLQDAAAVYGSADCTYYDGFLHLD